ncbi:MAG: PKD domain-containing protein [Bacteroidota bacterium]
MKKAHILFLLIGMAATTTFGQGPIILQGTVTANGSPVANHTVSVSMVFPAYNNTVTTDVNGVFNDTLFFNLRQAVILLATRDCRGNTLTSQAVFAGAGPVLVNIDQCPPLPRCQASFTSTTSGLSTSFRGTATGGVAPYSFTWNFGDSSSSSVQNPTHSYASPGTYRVCLAIADSRGCTDTICRPIVIRNPSVPLCQANFSSQRIGRSGQVIFTNLSRQTSNIRPTYSWNFGDGNTSTQKNPTHRYAQTGRYRVCLVISTGSVCADTFCQVVSVYIAPPARCRANFSYTRRPQTNTVAFTNLSTPGRYQWSFGDGNTSSQVNPSHTYRQAGAYRVCLITSDPATNCSDTICKAVWVGQRPPQRYTLTGTVSTIPANNMGTAIVYLIRHDSTAGTLTALDSTYTRTGRFAFTGLRGGDYWVKAGLLPGAANFSSYLPTYYGNALRWRAATKINVNGRHRPANITLIAGRNPGGPAFVGGLISQGANKTAGDPLDGISVLLLDRNDNPVSHTITDTEGRYEFDQIAYGTYKVVVEAIGKSGDDEQIVTVNASSSAIRDINFEVSNNDILITTSLEEASFGSITRTYPNPVSSTLYLEMELTQGSNLQISMIDLMGRELLRQSENLNLGNNRIEIPVGDLPAGAYLLKVTDGNDLLMERIIKAGN